VKGRLVFAEVAAKAILKGNYDIVIVDLPYFLHDGKWMDACVDLFPLVSSLVIKNADSFSTVAITPNDAACISVFLVSDLKDKGQNIAIKYIDDSKIIHYPSGCLRQSVPKFKDDYFVFVDS